jgi:hypothetical protein
MASDDEASALRCRVGNAERGVDRLSKVREAADAVVGAHDTRDRRMSGRSVLDAAVSTLRAALDSARGEVGG